jgi:very-short-patch-repair endonuclease
MVRRRESDLVHDYGWMAGLEAEIHRLGGIASAHELSLAGVTPGLLRAAVANRSITRVRKGWYARSDADTDVLRAWRVGGRLACVSAAAHRGLWVPGPRDVLHVSVPVTASRLRTPLSHRQRLAETPDANTHIHWDGPARYGERVAVPVALAVEQSFRCAGTNTGFVLLESAMNHRLLDDEQRAAMFSRLPAGASRLAAHACGLSESGIESMMKLILLRLGIPFRQQVYFDSVGRVDFVVGDRLVIEVDGREFHAEPYKDRHRDALLSIAGRRVLRFLYAQIVYESPIVEAAIVAALSRSDHNYA